MRAFITFATVALFILSSCKKEDAPKLGDDLTGTAKEVFDIAWQNPTLPDTLNHLVIDETSEFLNSETGAIETFVVETVSPYSSPSELQYEGDGVSFNGDGKSIKVVKSKIGTNSLVVRCFIGGREIMSRGLKY